MHAYGPPLPLLPAQTLLVSDRMEGPLRNVTLDQLSRNPMRACRPQAIFL